MKIRRVLLINTFLYLLFCGPSALADGLGVDSSPEKDGIKFKIGILEDAAGQLRFPEVANMDFKDIPGYSINLGLTESVYWLKIEVANSGTDSLFLLQVLNPNIDYLELYKPSPAGTEKDELSRSFPTYQREFNTQYPLFRIKVPVDSGGLFFIKASGEGVLELPITIGKSTTIIDWIGNDQLYFGIYSGIIIVMFLYNFFLYLSIRDNQYLFYVLYIVAVGLTQMCLKGYAAKFLWPDSVWMIIRGNHVVTVLSGIFAILFTLNFLRVRYFSGLISKILYGAIAVHLLSAALYVGGNYVTGQKILQINTGITSVIVLLTGFYIYASKGYRPAFFFSIAWSFFLTGVFVFVLKDTGVLPYNNLTSNSILIGSGLEVALLSFALADKINIYKKEKEESQTRALLISKENEKLVREQNVVLEQRVEERTHALKESNESLQMTLNHLKEAQAQLVEAEKMASLGQLTAGVAHEINNPINFVTANVAPLKRDIGMIWDAMQVIEEIALSDVQVGEKEQRIKAYKEEQDFDYLKTEIDFLLKGMHEGANRTAEIVKSLRIFSRVDEDSLKFADLNEGLDSTLVILNSIIREGIQVNKRYAELPLVECYPGKLNQVFLNIITNAIHAIKKKFNGEEGGVLDIETSLSEGNVIISISDNGTGMSSAVQEKIFEPFFTTKEVGEGTGLGMSIAYNTIKKHKGEIKIKSELGKGTQFMLIIPLTQLVG